MRILNALLALTMASLAVAKAGLIISEIDVVANKVEIVNTGPGTANMTGNWWCNIWQGSPLYVAVSAADIVAAQSTSTTLSLPAGGILTFQLTASFITNLQGELGLYLTGNFGSSADIIDYVSWGGAAVRDSVAAGEGIWVDNTFVPISAPDITAGRSIQLGAGLAGNSNTDYSLATPTIGVNQVTPPPVATTGSASGISQTTATLSGTVNAKGLSTTVTFQYGPISPGTAVAATPSSVTGSSDIAVSAALTGLTPGTIYYYRVVGTNANGTVNGATQTFTTYGPPNIETGITSQVTNAGATLGCAVSAKGADTTVTFEYGETNSYGTSVAGSPTPVTGTSFKSVSAVLSGLSPGTTYHYRVVASNVYGTTLGSDRTFTTAAPPTVALLDITAVSRSGNTLTVGFTGPPNTLPATWQVAGTSTLASFPDNKTADSTIAVTPAGSGNCRAIIDVTGEPASYFVRIVLP